MWFASFSPSFAIFLISFAISLSFALSLMPSQPSVHVTTLLLIDPMYIMWILRTVEYPWSWLVSRIVGYMAVWKPQHNADDPFVVQRRTSLKYIIELGTTYEGVAIRHGLWLPQKPLMLWCIARGMGRRKGSVELTLLLVDIRRANSVLLYINGSKELQEGNLHYSSHLWSTISCRYCSRELLSS